MNIDEICAEIPKAFLTTYRMKKWLYENGVEDAHSMAVPDAIPAIARMLVDWAYEAGKARGQQGGIPFKAVKQVGYDEAAKNPKAWYVLDKNGEQVHIGDKVKYLDEILTVFAINGDWIIPDESCRTIQADLCEKVIPDTREKIKDELAEKISTLFASSFEDQRNMAEQFISRIEALGE